MHTKDFNLIDLLLMNWRFKHVKDFIYRGDRLLDIGCGTQAKLLQYFSSSILFGIGIDYDLEQNKRIGNILIRQFKFSGILPFSDKSFNKVTMLAVLEHIPLSEVIDDLAEIRRVISNKGFLIMTTPTPRSKLLLETLAVCNVISKGEVFDHKKYYGKSDIVDLAKLTGFRVHLYKTFQLGMNSLIILAK